MMHGTIGGISAPEAMISSKTQKLSNCPVGPKGEEKKALACDIIFVSEQRRGPCRAAIQGEDYRMADVHAHHTLAEAWSA
jgi:hypothetical protein